MHSENGDDLEVVVGDRLLEEIFRGEGEPATAFGKLEFDFSHAVVGAVDDFGADEPFGFSEVEDEVVKFSFVRARSGQGLGKVVVGKVRPNHDEGINGECLGELPKQDTVFFGFQDVIFHGVLRESMLLPGFGIAEKECGVRPEAG